MSFLRNVGLNIGASGIGIAIGVVTTPLMTRVFPPVAYGQSGLIISLVSLTATLGLAGLPIAMAREQSGPEQPRLLRGAVAVMLLLLVVVFLLTLLAVRMGWPARYGLNDTVVWLLPAMVAFHTAHLTISALATANGTFPTLAAGRVIDAATARFGTLGLGITVFPGVAMMMVGDMAGKASSILTLLRNASLRRACRAGFGRMSSRELLGTLGDYRHFVLFANVAQALPVAVAFVLNWYVIRRVGIEAAGQFVLANSILSLAVTAIALGAAPAVFHELSRTADESPEDLERVALRIALISACLGTACMLPVLLFGPVLFQVVFGDAWGAAGEIARWLAVPFVLAFTLTVLLPVFRVLRKIRAWFWVQLFAFLGMLIGLVVVVTAGQLSGLGPQLALVLLLYNVSLIVSILMLLRIHGSAFNEAN